jgi:hypothetical protein
LSIAHFLGYYQRKSERNPDEHSDREQKCKLLITFLKRGSFESKKEKNNR